MEIYNIRNSHSDVPKLSLSTRLLHNTNVTPKNLNYVRNSSNKNTSRNNIGCGGTIKNYFM